MNIRKFCVFLIWATRPRGDQSKEGPAQCHLNLISDHWNLAPCFPCHNVCLPNNARMWVAFFPQWKSLSPHVDPHVGMMTTGVQWQWLSWFPLVSLHYPGSHLPLTSGLSADITLPSTIFEEISLVGMEDKRLPGGRFGLPHFFKKEFSNHQS